MDPNPMAWSPLARRIFLLTLPVSGPLWLAVMVAGAILGICVVIPVFLLWLIAAWAYEMWTGNRPSWF